MNEIFSRQKGLKRDASLRQIEATMRRVPLCVAVVLTLSTIRPSFGQAVRHSQYDCLTTPNGIPRKVIVTSENAVPYQDPTLKNKCPEELAHFRKYFIFNERKDSYEIGTATISSSRIGWVKKDDVLAWNTTMALYFINKTESNRLPVKIWVEKDDVGNEAESHFEEALDRLYTTEPFPILATQDDLVQIAFLWSADTMGRSLDPGKLVGPDIRPMPGTGVRPSDPSGEIGVLIEDVKRMEVVFVMDLTRSMGQYIEETRSKLTKIVEKLQEMQTEDNEKMPIAVGVVAYRDWLDKDSTFCTKSCPLTTNLQDVIDFLEKSSTQSQDKSLNEAVLEGISAAADSAMGWSKYAFKIICLVGDAAPHSPEDSDTQYFLQRGLPSPSEFFDRPLSENVAVIHDLLAGCRIQIHALGVGNNGDMIKSFRDLSGRNFRSIDSSDGYVTELTDTLMRLRKDHQALATFLGHKVTGRGDPVKLSPEQEEAFRLIINPAQLDWYLDLDKSRVKTGWFRNQDMKNIVICTHVRRRELDDWEVLLRQKVLDQQDKGDSLESLMDTWGAIIIRYVGNVDVRNMDEVNKLIGDVPLLPATHDLSLEKKKIQTQLTNLMKLGMMDKLFNENDEAWVPVGYLPGTAL